MICNPLFRFDLVFHGLLFLSRERITSEVIRSHRQHAKKPAQPGAIIDP